MPLSLAHTLQKLVLFAKCSSFEQLLHSHSFSPVLLYPLLLLLPTFQPRSPRSSIHDFTHHFFLCHHDFVTALANSHLAPCCFPLITFNDGARSRWLARFWWKLESISANPPRRPVSRKFFSGRFVFSTATCLPSISPWEMHVRRLVQVLARRSRC